MLTKTHWTTEHYDQVPIDLWELVRAMTAQRIRRGWTEDYNEVFLKVVAHITTGTEFAKLDAYRLYGYRQKYTVGIRYGNEGSQYISPDIEDEIGIQFDLDPLNRD